ncbi:MAG: rubredoxin [Phycisphaerae bacterium]|nr:rubredoxin [Phycisphaerae bacterium]
MLKYVCTMCGWEYDPAKGYPKGGIAPGTSFEDLPDDFKCPVCGALKLHFMPRKSPGDDRSS